MRRPRRLRWTALSLLGLICCSPTARVRAHAALADGTPLDASKVALRARSACSAGTPPTPPRPPAPGPAETTPPFPVARDAAAAPEAGAAAGPDAGPTAAARASDEGEIVGSIGIEDGAFAYSLRGVQCQTSMTAWYDASGDGLVGAGDYVGSVGPVAVTDHGLCAGNLNDVGVIRLSPWAP